MKQPLVLSSSSTCFWLELPMESQSLLTLAKQRILAGEGDEAISQMLSLTQRIESLTNSFVFVCQYQHNAAPGLVVMVARQLS